MPTSKRFALVAVLLCAIAAGAQQGNNQNNFNQGSLASQAATIQSFASDPACTSNQIWYNSTTNFYKVCPGGHVVSLFGVNSQGTPTTLPPMIGQNWLFVDGTTHTSLASAIYDPTCYNTNTSGCVIYDDLPEIFHVSPLPGLGQYTIEFSQGTGASTSNKDQAKWRVLDPFVIASDRVRGQAPANAPNLNGTTGSVLKSCGLTVASCGGLYSPNASPTPPAPTGVGSTSGGSLAAATYFLEWVPLVNINTAADSAPTASLSQPGTSTAVFAGQGFSDGTTNCGGSACTQVVIQSGTTGTGSPTWGATQYSSVTTWGTAQFRNIGNITAASSFGSVGLGQAGPESAGIVVGGAGAGSISGTTPTVPTEPACAKNTAYTTGQYVTGPFGVNTHLYRAVGSGTTDVTNGCNMSTVGGSQTQDPTATNLYWQEVGSPTNYLPVAGYILYAATVSGSETSQLVPGGAVNVTCGTVVQVANQTSCAPGSSYLLTAVTAGRGVPDFDFTAPTTAIEDISNTNSNSGPDNPASEFTNMVIDADGIATEAGVNNGGQENSCYCNDMLLTGTETPLGWLSPNSQNGAWFNVNIGNLNTASAVVYQRVAGCMVMDARNGTTFTFGGKATCVPNNPPGALVQPEGFLCDAGPAQECGKAFALHVEQVGDTYYQKGGNAEIDEDAVSTNNVTTGVHIGVAANSTDAIHIIPKSANAVQDDTITAGTGNCNSNNSYCPTGAGSYFLGPADSQGNRQRICTEINCVWFANGGININVAGAGTNPPINGLQVTSVNAGTTNVPAAVVTETFNNSSQAGDVMDIVLKNTSSAAGSTILNIFGGSSGATSLASIDSAGDIQLTGVNYMKVNSLNWTGCGASSSSCAVSNNGVIGGFIGQGADNSNNGSSSRAGLAVVRGGELTNATPNAAAMEGAGELGQGYLKGTAIALVGDVVCGTTTAWTVTDCSHTGPAVNIIGIATSTANPVGVVVDGLAVVSTDGAATLGDILCMGTTTDGKAHDNGTAACATAGTTIGVVVSVSGTLNTMLGNSTGTQTLSTTLVAAQLHIGK